MIKIFFNTILFLLFYQQAISGTNSYILGSTATVGTTCPAGTYDFAWNGDYPSDTDKACTNSGAASQDGTMSGGTLSSSYGYSGVGLRVTANNQYLTWSYVLDNSLGTVWMWVYFADETPASTTPFFESSYNTSNRLYLQALTNGRLQATYQGAGTPTQSSSSTGDTLANGWNRVAMAWDQVNGHLTWKIGAGSWYGVTGGSLTAWAGATNDTTIGENELAAVFTETVYIDDLYYVNSYQAADPMP